VIERRVLFRDVVLVTLHRHYGTAYLLTTGLISLFFIIVAVTAYGSFTRNSDVVAIVLLTLGLPSMLSFLIRALFGVDRITIFGRRSKATVGFRLRKRRAWEAYDRICTLVRNAQQGVTSVPPENRADDAPWIFPV